MNSFGSLKRLNFSMPVAEILSTTTAIENQMKNIYEKISKVPLEKVDWENTIVPLLKTQSDLMEKQASVTLPMYVASDDDVRKESAKATENLSKLDVQLKSNVQVYQRFKQLKTSFNFENKIVEKRLVDKICVEFERSGCGLQNEEKSKFIEIQNELAEISVAFQNALNEEKTKLLFAASELKGLSQSFIDALPVDEESQKKIVSLKYTDLFPVLQMCSVAATRKAMEDANSSKCSENVARLERALQLRLEAAKLLGYASHAEYVLAERMAKTPTAVQEFLDDLNERLAPKAVAEFDALLKLKQADEPGATTLEAYDWRYYQNVRKTNDFAVDRDEIKQYFELEHVLQYIFELYQLLFHCRFEELTSDSPDFAVWHDDVRQFVVYDTLAPNDGRVLGAFYLDLHPRDGKYGHACVVPLVPTFTREDGSRNEIVCAMLANFSKKTADKPALLYHQEVVTLAHEFGHVMHGVLSEAKFARFSGTSVERDFVECPSQMLENWCYDAQVLAKISKHVDTGKPLPAELIEKMIAAKNADTGLFNKRQLFFGKFDQTIHGENGAGVDTTELWSSLWHELTNIGASKGNGSGSFGHMFGYDASYYGYLWSQVFSADLYSAFKSDPFNATLGAKYRQLILAPGGSVDSIESLKKFLAREPNNKEFLKSIGL